MDFVLQDDQYVNCAVVLLDAAGNTVAGEEADSGSVGTSVSDPTILSAVVSPDQSSVAVAALGPAGTGIEVSVTGTLDGNPLTGSLTFDVTDSPVASIGLIPGTPQPNPPAA